MGREKLEYGDLMSPSFTVRKGNGKTMQLMKQKLQAVLITFCTCCILICLVCFVASFKLSCV